MSEILYYAGLSPLLLQINYVTMNKEGGMQHCNYGGMFYKFTPTAIDCRTSGNHVHLASSNCG